jgi:hypothetical protein
VLSVIADIHNREDLDWYIVFWKRVMPGTAIRMAYPNLEQRFNKVKLGEFSGPFSPEFIKADNTFENNLNSLIGRT